MPKRTTTLSQLSAELGLSPTSISMILNHKNLSSFNAETVNRVMQVAEERGYRKRAATSHNVAILCPSVMNPYYATIIQGMEQVLRANGYGSRIFTSYWSPENERQTLEELSAENTAGVLYCMIPLQGELAQQKSKELPMVVVGDRRTDLSVDMIELNNYQCGVLVAEHLIALGHQRVAYVSTTLDDAHSSRVRRLEGIRDSYARLCPQGSVQVLEQTVTPLLELDQCSIEHQVGYQLITDNLHKLDVTAFMAINDMVAYGVRDALLDAGKRIPEDYSVTGCDNIYPSRFKGVELTTVEHSVEQRGRGAARLLLNRMQAGAGVENEDNAFTRIEYMSCLVKGSTTAQPRGSVIESK